MIRTDRQMKRERVARGKTGENQANRRKSDTYNDKQGKHVRG